MRNPRLTCSSPLSSCHGTRNMITRSGSMIRTLILGLHVGHQSGDIVFHGLLANALRYRQRRVISEGREPDKGRSMPAVVHERVLPIPKTEEKRSKIFDLPSARPIIDHYVQYIRARSHQTS